MAADFWAQERANRRQTRMMVAVFLLLYCVLGLGLDFLLGTLRFQDGSLRGFPVLTVGALIVGMIQASVSYYAGAALVLGSVHAQRLMPDNDQHKMVLNVIQEMTLAARMPPIKAYVMPDPAPNAFSTGRDPAHSYICVTQGLIDQMDREELQGVIGHEMAHIRNYDIRTMMMIAVMVGGVALLADFVYYGGASSDDHDSEGGNLLMIAVIILAVLAPILSQLLAMAVSRRREYLADASSVEFTRNPRALTRALEHLTTIETPIKNASRGTAHLFIINPLEGVKKEDKEGWLDNLLSTHPPLRARIERLRAMGGGAAPAAAASAGAPA
ncbi:MAG TPA: M48 family metallopeptidase [Candidatus Binataceae bacterium]|jgi:heat shock protein HtpX|nr:M48 family metallopeptidase [Candidatus Binataceae bacterium]